MLYSRPRAPRPTHVYALLLGEPPGGNPPRTDRVGNPDFDRSDPRSFPRSTMIAATAQRRDPFLLRRDPSPWHPRPGSTCHLAHSSDAEPTPACADPTPARCRSRSSACSGRLPWRPKRSAPGFSRQIAYHQFDSNGCGERTLGTQHTKESWTSWGWTHVTGHAQLQQNVSYTSALPFGAPWRGRSSCSSVQRTQRYLTRLRSLQTL